MIYFLWVNSMFNRTIQNKALNWENWIECIRQSIWVQYDYRLRALVQNLLILPWTSVFGARSRQTSWPEWNRALLGCLSGSWDKHTSLKADNFEDMPNEISSPTLVKIGHKYICNFFPIHTKWIWNAECCNGFTCELRVCFGPPCFAPEFLQPRKTPKNPFYFKL